MSITEYSRECKQKKKIAELLTVAKGREKNELQILILNAINSGELTMMDYVRLFSPERDYKVVKENIDSFISQAKKDNPELYGKNKPIDLAQKQVRNLINYQKPYRSTDFIGSSKGYKDKKTGEIVMTPITEEHIKYAKKYLQVSDEYICYGTMDSTISKLIKGELTIDEIKKKEEQHGRFLKLEEKEETIQQLIQEESKTREIRDAAKLLLEEYKQTVKEGEDEIPIN